MFSLSFAAHFPIGTPYLKKMNDKIEKQLRDKKRGASYIGKGGSLESVMNRKKKKQKVVIEYTDNEIIKKVHDGTLLKLINTLDKVIPLCKDMVFLLGWECNKKRGEV